MKGTPPMTDKKLTSKEAEDLLAALEKPAHDVARAASKLRRAELDGDAAVIGAAAGVYADALKAQEVANISQRHVDTAAQAVLDSRGEAHTETNILPPDHGIKSVLAARALAVALGDFSPGRDAAIERTLKDLEQAEAEDAADKAAHVAESHARTLSALEGEA